MHKLSDHCPGAIWNTCPPEELGLARSRLQELAILVGGHGCVVHRGYLCYTWGTPSKSCDIASAFKPVLSTLLLFALQEGRLESVDDPIAEFEPRLLELNGGKDAAITWRHLASQLSNYGLAELPGEAYAYNDYAIALYYDLLTKCVFESHGTHLIKTRLADVLGFEDAFTAEVFGPYDRPGRLGISVRDFARFGLLYLQGGRWQGQQVLNPNLIRMAITGTVPAETPLSRGTVADMLPGQRTLGGGKTITPLGPGIYSFNWWTNTLNGEGKRLYPMLSPDTFIASGHGPRRELFVIPDLDLVVVWNESRLQRGDRAGAAAAARLIREAASGAASPPLKEPFMEET